MNSFSQVLCHVHARDGQWAVLAATGSYGFRQPRCRGLLIYINLAGAFRVSMDSGAILDLADGHIAVVQGDESHVVETGRVQMHPVFDHLASHDAADTPSIVEIAGDGDTASRLLVGRIQVSWPIALEAAGIPTVFHLPPRSERGAAEIQRLYDLACDGAGACAYLTKAAELSLLRALRENAEIVNRIPSNPESAQIAQALRIVGQAPGNDWSVSRIAREVGMSRSSFAAKFVRHTGRRPMEMVTEYRLAAAAELLKTDRVSIAEIAHRIGYRSEASFSKRFTRRFGETPGSYRRSARGNGHSEAPEGIAAHLSIRT